ncbi:8289_t:CDS:2, partial [Scutellospora calospora]
KTTPAMRKQIIHMINNQCLLIIKVSQHFQLASSTVQSIVNRFNEENRITFKARDTTIVQRKEYVDNIFQENIDMYNDVIYINKSGFNLHLTHSQGHASSGKPAIKEIVKQYGKNITII